jgi:hypothetical protein
MNEYDAVVVGGRAAGPGFPPTELLRLAREEVTGNGADMVTGRAAIAINADLVDENVADAVRDFRSPAPPVPN